MNELNTRLSETGTQRRTTLALVLCVVPVTVASAQSNIDPAHRNAWCENVGWTNWRHGQPNPTDGAAVRSTHLAGFVWAENIGWINLGSGSGPYANNAANAATFGVNVDTQTGELFGMAWSENTGWINFDTRAALGPDGRQALLDVCANRLSGYAWGENIGWINLDDATGYVALGPNCAHGDVACDGVIGLYDYSEFLAAVTGPGITTDCPLFDFDDDGDVDLHDFGAMQSVFTGE